jgi:hypothetical protein
MRNGAVSTPQLRSCEELPLLPPPPPLTPTRPTTSCSCNNKTISATTSTAPTAIGPDVDLATCYPCTRNCPALATVHALATVGLVREQLLMYLNKALIRIRKITKYNDALLMLRCFRHTYGTHMGRWDADGTGTDQITKRFSQ